MALEFSLCVCQILLTLFKVVKFSYSATATNKLTKIPFVLVSVYTCTLLACYLVGYYSIAVMTSLFFQYSIISVVCYFWTLIILMTGFEWEIITSLVVFQQAVDLNTMGVMKHKFNADVELKIMYKYTLYNLLNLVYHLAKIVLPWLKVT